MLKNQINVTIDDATVNLVITKFKEARTALIAVLIASLSPEQKKAIFKMGKDSLQFITEGYNFAQTPALKAPEVDLTLWTNDLTAYNQLLKIMAVLSPLHSDVEDIMFILGSELMDAGQHNYRFLRYQASVGVPTAQPAYEQLRALRWERPAHHTATPPPPAA